MVDYEIICIIFEIFNCNWDNFSLEILFVLFCIVLMVIDCLWCIYSEDCFGFSW